MTITNRYIKRSRISEAKFREFVKYFALDLDASKIALLTGLNRNTVNRYLLLIRNRIAEYCEQSSPFQGEVEVDESYFGARRIKGKRGRGACGKTPSSVFSKEVASSIRESFPIALNKRCRALYAAKWTWKVSSIPTPGAVIMAWLTWDTKSIIVCTMETMSLPMGKDISMALNPSGHMPKGGS